jgi:hypothetical protein
MRFGAGFVGLGRFQDRYTEPLGFPPISQKARNGWGTETMGTAIVELP